MKKVKLWTGLLAIFLSGFAAGFFTAGVHAKYKFERIFSGGPPTAQKLVVDKLTRELDLTDSQRAHIKAVMARTQNELLKWRLKHQPEVRALIDASIAEMKTDLDPEQCRKLDRHFEMLRKKWWAWRGYPNHKAHTAVPGDAPKPPGPSAASSAGQAKKGPQTDSESSQTK